MHMANRRNELGIRNFELDLTNTPWAKMMINKLHERGLSSASRLWSYYRPKRPDVGNQFLFTSKEENEEEED